MDDDIGQGAVSGQKAGRDEGQAGVLHPPEREGWGHEEHVVPAGAGGHRGCGSLPPPGGPQHPVPGTPSASPSRRDETGSLTPSFPRGPDGASCWGDLRSEDGKQRAGMPPVTGKASQPHPHGEPHLQPSTRLHAAVLKRPPWARLRHGHGHGGSGWLSSPPHPCTPGCGNRRREAPETPHLPHT